MQLACGFGCRSGKNTHDPNNPVEQLCLICLKRVKNLDTHLQNHDPDGRVLFTYCPCCGLFMGESDLLCQHIFTHFCPQTDQKITEIDRAELVCFHCELLFTKPKMLLNHVASHFPVTVETPMTIHCVECGKSMQRSTLRRHLDGHSALKSFICQHCGKQYAQESGLVRHVRAIHEGVRRYKCPICPLVFETHLKLREHQTQHPDPRPFQCDACGRTFLSQKHLYHHRKYHHTDRGLRVSCDQCFRVFSSTSVMRRHHKVVHLGLKEFQCDVCSAKVSTKQYLKEHLRTHSDERPEICAVCGKTFQMRGNLRQHMKTHRERTQVCDVCGRRFARRCQLLIHMGSHRGFTPLVCQMCEKTFLLKTDLAKHLAEHAADHYLPSL